jgi:hypothetical protein
MEDETIVPTLASPQLRKGGYTHNAALEETYRRTYCRRRRPYHDVASTLRVKVGNDLKSSGTWYPVFFLLLMESTHRPAKRARIPHGCGGNVVVNVVVFGGTSRSGLELAEYVVQCC